MSNPRFTENQRGWLTEVRVQRESDDVLLYDLGRVDLAADVFERTTWSLYRRRLDGRDTVPLVKVDVVRTLCGTEDPRRWVKDYLRVHPFGRGDAWFEEAVEALFASHSGRPGPGPIEDIEFALHACVMELAFVDDPVYPRPFHAYYDTVLETLLLRTVINRASDGGVAYVLGKAGGRALAPTFRNGLRPQTVVGYHLVSDETTLPAWAPPRAWVPQWVTNAAHTAAGGKGVAPECRIGPEHPGELGKHGMPDPERS